MGQRIPEERPNGCPCLVPSLAVLSPQGGRCTPLAPSRLPALENVQKRNRAEHGVPLPYPRHALGHSAHGKAPLRPSNPPRLSDLPPATFLGSRPLRPEELRSPRRQPRLTGNQAPQRPSECPTPTPCREPGLRHRTARTARGVGGVSPLYLTIMGILSQNLILTPFTAELKTPKTAQKRQFPPPEPLVHLFVIYSHEKAPKWT